MLTSGEDLQALHALGGQFVLGEHTFDGVFDDTLRVFFTDFFKGGVFDAAWEAGVAIVYFASFLVASDNSVFGVDDNDVVATINVRSVARLVFTY